MMIAPNTISAITALVVGVVVGAVVWDQVAPSTTWRLADWASLLGAVATVAGSFWLAGQRHRRETKAVVAQTLVLCAQVERKLDEAKTSLQLFGDGMGRAGQISAGIRTLRETAGMREKGDGITAAVPDLHFRVSAMFDAVERAAAEGRSAIPQKRYADQHGNPVALAHYWHTNNAVAAKLTTAVDLAAQEVRNVRRIAAQYS